MKYFENFEDFEDIIESIIMITIVKMIMDGSVDLLKVIKVGVILGVILKIVREIKPDLH